jgi:hypothetical protein
MEMAEYVIEGRRRTAWGETWEPLVNIGPDIAEGVFDEFSREQFALCDLRVRRVDAADGVTPTVEEQPPTGRHPKCGHPNCNCFEGCVMRMRDEERAAAGVEGNDGR